MSFNSQDHQSATYCWNLTGTICRLAGGITLAGVGAGVLAGASYLASHPHLLITAGTFLLAHPITLAAVIVGVIAASVIATCIYSCISKKQNSAVCNTFKNMRNAFSRFFTANSREEHETPTPQSESRTQISRTTYTSETPP